jgi:galactose mutarotase-like enzyme
MPARADSGVVLTAEGLTAVVLPDEGGVIVDARLDGRPFLAATPWGSSVIADATPAPDEATWVSRWRGGWQLCLPSAGQPDPADPRQGFHGAASQAPWTVLEVSDARVTLTWRDADLVAERTIALGDGRLAVSTVLRNDGAAERAVVAAEHLILGGDVLTAPLELATNAGGLQPLDYAGMPDGAEVPWPGVPTDRWTTVDSATPARVAGLVDARRVTASGPHVEVAVAWHGLPHALLWEELGVSTEHPWNGEVRALGIEPSSVPHGAGTAHGDAAMLAPGESLAWETTLEVRFTGGVT